MILALLWAAPVFAQSDSDAVAEALFVEGRELMEAEKYEAACEKFRASEEAAPSVGARFNLGDCSKAQGKTASAWAFYRAAANLARDRRDTRRARIAEERAEAIESELTYVLLAVPEPHRVDGLEISFDGERQPEPLWGERFPVDPGEHEARAAADGYRAWTTSVEAGAPGETRTVEVPELEEIPEEETPEGRAGPGGSSGRPGPPGPIDRPAEPGMTTGRKVALGLGAASVAAFIAGSAFGLSARSKWNDAKNNHCNDDLQCDPKGISLAADARRNGDIATTSLLVGVGAAAGAAVLWFVAGPTERPETDVALSPRVDGRSASLFLEGRF